MVGNGVGSGTHTRWEGITSVSNTQHDETDLGTRERPSHPSCCFRKRELAVARVHGRCSIHEPRRARTARSVTKRTEEKTVMAAIVLG